LKIQSIDFDVLKTIHGVSVVGDLVFLAGFGGSDFKTGKVMKGIEKQVEIAFDKVEAALEAAGSSLDNVVKVTTYITDSDLIDRARAVSRKRWKGMGPPSTMVIVSGLGLPGMFYEVDIIAVRPDGAPKPKKIIRGWDKNIRRK